MKRQTLIGLGLLAVGAWALFRGLRPESLFLEIVWLAALAWLALLAWRALRGQPLGLRLGVHGVLALIGVTTLDRLAGPTILAFIGLAFLATYRARGRRQTAFLVPAAVMFTLAATAGVDALFPRWDEGIVFLLGMTATFTATYLLPRRSGGASWALWPALAWAFITVLANDPWGGLARWLLPLVLIGTGVVILGWSRGRR